jgi:hypothetical protein
LATSNLNPPAPQTLHKIQNLCAHLPKGRSMDRSKAPNSPLNSLLHLKTKIGRIPLALTQIHSGLVLIFWFHNVFPFYSKNNQNFFKYFTFLSLLFLSHFSSWQSSLWFPSIAACASLPWNYYYLSWLIHTPHNLHTPIYLILTIRTSDHYYPIIVPKSQLYPWPHLHTRCHFEKVSPSFVWENALISIVP